MKKVVGKSNSSVLALSGGDLSLHFSSIVTTHRHLRQLATCDSMLTDQSSRVAGSGIIVSNKLSLEFRGNNANVDAAPWNDPIMLWMLE